MCIKSDFVDTCLRLFSSLALFGSCAISGCMHKTSTLINDHGIHGAGIFVLFDPYEWPEEET